MEAFKKEMQTRRGQTIGMLIDIVLLYVFASIAIDSANMFAYAAAIFFFGSAVYHAVTLIKMLQYKTTKKRKR